jgi:hypothetical protein
MYLSGLGGKKLIGHEYIPSDEDDSENEDDIFDTGNSTFYELQ